MYYVTMTPNELAALAWLADRYQSAGDLYSALELADPTVDLDQVETNAPLTWRMSEADAWRFVESLECEEIPGLIPYLDYDSHLGQSLLALEVAA